MPTPQKLKKALENSNNQVDRLTILIEDLLDMTRIESGKLSYKFENVNFSELTRELIERFTEDFHIVHCDLETIINENIYCVCDRYRMEQVITNLITNTIKYGEKKPIKIRLDKYNKNVILAVKDHGIGIPKEKHDKIFERFERAISSTNISGLGLGLYISKKIVDAHKGKIEVESELGIGSTFKVFIPID
jgi:signal transduction histidine kinase